MVEQEMLVLRAEGLQWPTATIPLEQIKRGLTAHVRQVESMPPPSFTQGISKMELRVLVIEDQAFQQEALKSLLHAASKIAVRADPLRRSLSRTALPPIVRPPVFAQLRLRRAA